MSLKDVENNDFKLENYDEVTIFKVPKWYEDLKIEITGEVMYPGIYTIEEGEKLSDVIVRAGGFTNNAFIEGALFTRDSVKKMQEKAYRDSLIALKKDATTLAATPTEAGQNAQDKMKLVEAIDRLLADAENYAPIGRVSINLDKDLEKFKNSSYNVTLKNKDKLVIPSFNETISILGEVFNQNTVIFEDGKDVSYYINKAGGLKDSADEDSIYIIHANGDAEKYDAGTFLFGQNSKILKGDTIVVPMKIDVTNDIQIAKDITSILYQMAVTVASMHTVGAI
ncbi:MAG: capsule biosynthesis GfcC family protein [Campylobacterales bacterium]|nr:capsule biosynthesis GfcC family protein [Campylobacterales bacterium]